MPKLSPNAWKILCFIIRKTRGWQKEQDQISISQIASGTGIKNRTTITTAIKELEKQKYVLVTRPDDKVTSNSYALNVDLEIKPSTEIGLPKKDEVQSDKKPSTKSVPQPSTENGLGVVQKSDSQKKDIKKHEKKKDIGSSPLSPDTPQSQLLFERLAVEFHAKGRRAPKRFPSMACKEKFDQSATRLNGNISPAVQRAFEKGIMSVASVVDFIAKWQLNGATNGTHRQTNRQTTSKHGTGHDLAQQPVVDPFHNARDGPD
jgi:phage replication O-like protein O